MGNLQAFEYGLGPTAILLLVAYHLYLFHKTRHKPTSTSQGLARRTRALWVESIMKNNKDILAVQTLRNWTMASTFLASTAIIIGLGIFNLALTADKQGELSLLIGPLSVDHPVLWTAKLVLLGIDFLIVFFNFTLGMRGYYLAIPLALWLFGPLWLMSGTLVMIAVLYRLDRGI